MQMGKTYTGYWIYQDLLNNGYIEIKTSNITKQNWDLHYNHLLNLIRDYIETDFLKVPCILVTFDDGTQISLGVVDYWYNIIMWNMIIIPSHQNVGRPIRPDDLFFCMKGMTRKKIKDYIDRKFIDPYRSILPNIDINNIIDDSLYCFLVIDEFSMFLANSISLEECFLRPALKDKEVYDILNLDLSEVPLEETKNVAMKATDKLINKVIKDKDNPLSDYFISEECIKKAQFSEVAVSIAQKPDGHGGIYPVKIDTSLINGGVSDLVHFYIESSTGRTAQIVLKYNVGDAGHMARLLGLNNMDTKLHPDPHYSCHTRNFVELVINNQKELSRYLGRYYRFDPDGREYRIDRDSTHVIGKKLYLRSPITCASKESDGICYKCYGDLAYTNRDINVGKYAAEVVSAALTQRMLSAKHLLKADIKPFNWSDSFKEFFDVDLIMISLQDELPQSTDLDNTYIIIDKENIVFETEEDLQQYNKYIDFFKIQYPDGHIEEARSSNNISMYFTQELEDIIYNYTKIKDLEDLEDGDVIKLPLSQLGSDSLFVINIMNNDLSDSLKHFTSIINTKSMTERLSLHQMLETMNRSIDEIGLNVSSVHMEILISNQVRDANNLIMPVDWEVKDTKYIITTLNRSLQYSPSITKSLSFQYVKKILIDPLSYEKDKSSVMDLFFMDKPQDFLGDDLVDRSK